MLEKRADIGVCQRGRIDRELGVRFCAGSVVGVANAPPYTFTWSNVAPGSYNLTAKATDNLGATNTSGIVNVKAVASNILPLVVLTQPVACSSLVGPTNITLSADAIDPDGTIAKVEFFQGTTLIGTATAAPFMFTWNSVTGGSYSLTAKATDSLGGSSTSVPVTITVTTPNTPPTVAITSPASGTSYPPSASIAIAATASDTDGNITKVDFFANGTLIGTSMSPPYGTTWMNAPSGNYTVTARATDNRGAATTSTAISITVNPNSPPTVSLTAPAMATSVPCGHRCDAGCNRSGRRRHDCQS